MQIGRGPGSRTSHSPREPKPASLQRLDVGRFLSHLGGGYGWSFESGSLNHGGGFTLRWVLSEAVDTRAFPTYGRRIAADNAAPTLTTSAHVDTAPIEALRL